MGNTIKMALEKVTGIKVSDYAILTLGNDFIKAVKKLNDKNLPVHFNDVKDPISLEDIKKGYTLLTETDVIVYNGYYYTGINRIYSPMDIKRILKEEKSLLVK